MNAAHLHLLVNHAPLFALLFAVPVLAYGVARRDLGAWRAAVFLLVVGGVTGVVALRTGEPAEEFLEDQIELVKARVHEHEERAEVATILAIVAGALAPLAYWRRGRHEGLAGGLTLAAALAAAGAMAWASSAGGAIRHPEELELATAAAAGARDGSDNASRK